MSETKEERKPCANCADDDPHSQAKNWYHVEVGIWHSTVHIFIGDRRSMVMTMPFALDDFGYKQERISKELNAFRANNPNFLSLEDNGGDTRSGLTDVFLRLDRFSYEVGDLALAWHECLHAANIILRQVNLVGDTNVEGLAYTQEYIATRFLRQYVERHNPENCGDVCVDAKVAAHGCDGAEKGGAE